MPPLADTLMDQFFARADIGHVALMIWALGASALVAFAVREAAEAARRTEAFMQDFLQELARFNGASDHPAAQSSTQKEDAP